MWNEKEEDEQWEVFIYTPAQSPRGADEEIERQVWCTYTVGFMFFGGLSREVGLSHVNLDAEFRMPIIVLLLFSFGRRGKRRTAMPALHLVLSIQRENFELCEKKVSRRRCLYTSAKAPRRAHRERLYCLCV